MEMGRLSILPSVPEPSSTYQAVAIWEIEEMFSLIGVLCALGTEAEQCEPCSSELCALRLGEARETGVRRWPVRRLSLPAPLCPSDAHSEDELRSEGAGVHEIRS